MAKVTAKYEILYIIDLNKTEEEIAALVEKFKSLTEEYGSVAEVDQWGKRRLAYPIEDMNEGYYVMMNCEAKPEMPAEIDRVFGITDGILRSLIINKDE